MNHNTAPQTPERSGKLSACAKKTLAALAVVGAIAVGGLECAAQKQQQKEQQHHQAVERVIKPFAQRMAAKMIELKDTQLPKGAERHITTNPRGETKLSLSYCQRYYDGPHDKGSYDEEYDKAYVELPKVNGKLDPKGVVKASVYSEYIYNDGYDDVSQEVFYSPTKDYKNHHAWTVLEDIGYGQETDHTVSEARIDVEGAKEDFATLLHGLKTNKESC